MAKLTRDSGLRNINLSRSIAPSMVNVGGWLLGFGGTVSGYRLPASEASLASAAAFFAATASSLAQAYCIARSTKRAQSFLWTSTILKINTPPFGTSL
jgi:hypothetical protein